MSVLGLIAEYNPFHNGHLYHFNTSFNITQAEYSVCTISGSFVQRGEPALVDKWARARMALMAGIDLVIELPVVYSVQSAEIFAYGGVSLLNSLGVVDKLCFGSEAGSIGLLDEVSSIISKEPGEYRQLLKYNMESGKSFPSSRASAVYEYLVRSGKSKDEALEAYNLMGSSNNILGLEYMKWLHRLNSSMAPVTIKRLHSNYNDEELDTKMPSATAIRKSILENGSLEFLSKFIPDFTLNILSKHMNDGMGPVAMEDFSMALLCLLRRLSLTEISSITDVNEGLEHKIKKAAVMSGSIDELIQNIKSKRYTETRIKRILIHALLGMKREDLELFKTCGGPQYVRVLGFSEKGKKLLADIKKKCPLPIITNLGNYKKYDSQCIRRMIEFDILSTDLYCSAYKYPDLRKGGYDFYKAPEQL